MPALAVGEVAPNFELPILSRGKFSLRESLSRGPVVAAFFKISCPVCQFALPFLDRIYRALAGEHVTIVGVAQNSAKDTTAFVKEFGITFPIPLDDTNSFPVSNAYGLTNVPTTFWIAQDGDIEISSVGWDRADIEDIARKAAEANGGKVIPVFEASESIPDFRAG